MYAVRTAAIKNLDNAQNICDQNCNENANIQALLQRFRNPYAYESQSKICTSYTSDEKERKSACWSL